MVPEERQALVRASDSASRAGWGCPLTDTHPQFMSEDASESQTTRCPYVLKAQRQGSPLVPSKSLRASLRGRRPLNLQQSTIRNSDPPRPHTVSPKLCHSYLPLNITFLFLMQNIIINRLSQTKLKRPLLSPGERVRARVSPFSQQTDAFGQLNGLMHMAEPQGPSTREK